ncbi:MAG: DUF1284 domain-containing protein [Peptostreptococcaceae bacterium]|nr:DUF1284 domain-containing protein [Peptostreptococcaceae bacterium]
MKLRPHHLMCTQSYAGKGYDEDFVKVMDKITYELRNNKEYLINIVFSTDDICVACPNMLDINLCKTNEKVNNIDSKVIKYFNLEEKEYIYKDIVNYIKNNITLEIMDDICKECEWYNISECRSIICK